MKLSRRGKLARRGKHTKRAGKHLRYKGKSKKFRASKRYHRGNKRTYKRGKRFHRGGADFESVFVVKKHGSPFEQEQNFITTIELNKNNVATIKLVRKDKQNITFTITGTFNEVRALLQTLDDPRYVGSKNVDFKKLDDDNKTGTYDFYRNGQNTGIFETIVTKLDSLYQTNYDASMPQHHFASSVSHIHNNTRF